MKNIIFHLFYSSTDSNVNYSTGNQDFTLFNVVRGLNPHLDWRLASTTLSLMMQTYCHRPCQEISPLFPPPPLVLEGGGGKA